MKVQRVFKNYKSINLNDLLCMYNYYPINTLFYKHLFLIGYHTSYVNKTHIN